MGALKVHLFQPFLQTGSGLLVISPPVATSPTGVINKVSNGG
ncbi:conserved hypothetical protein [Histoplasma capsulatum var. duboisii H88]|uniref:Uncharacterized protein n=2 Tax=Ajellomyces capsulatus TaxID=5037 RepID=F0UGP5_AJEC8|nr:conserved hypothetical protein [Histoplasma capsulatum H143]EGC44345.1 conserved hypothetical protein [Histoplasma capsulatum var. duboisii H88]